MGGLKGSPKKMIGFEISENILEPVESNIFEKVMDGNYLHDEITNI